jgi:hypothetical protein
VERAAIGRRSSETEIDLLELLLEGGGEPGAPEAPRAPDGQGA